jgi:AraC family L-rhamnose operon regulatory protein RhaS
MDILKNLKEQLFIQSDSWPCLTRSYLLELLFLVERTYCVKNITHNTNKRFTTDEILLYLHNNYMKKITIGDLTKRFNTNQTTLSKEFKSSTGQTIISYVLKLRVLIAAGMLRDTTLKIELIIERVGFNNITHFNKVFKEYNQCLPSEYRKRFKPYE